jgi:hypothetical protein
MFCDIFYSIFSSFLCRQFFGVSFVAQRRNAESKHRFNDSEKAAENLISIDFSPDNHGHLFYYRKTEKSV